MEGRRAVTRAKLFHQALINWIDQGINESKGFIKVGRVPKWRRSSLQSFRPSPFHTLAAALPALHYDKFIYYSYANHRHFKKKPDVPAEELGYLLCFLSYLAEAQPIQGNSATKLSPGSENHKSAVSDFSGQITYTFLHVDTVNITNQQQQLVLNTYYICSSQVIYDWYLI